MPAVFDRTGTHPRRPGPTACAPHWPRPRRRWRERARVKLPTVQADVAAQGGELRRAWPRDAEHLLLDVGRDGGPTAGQWFADADRARSVADRTPGATVHGRLVLQPAGADRRLAGLPGLLAEPGTELLAHRPERRAVVRGPGGYTKLVRPDRFPAVAAAAGRAAALPVRVPRVLAADAGGGRLTTAALPGRPLHELLDTPAAVPACRALGAALAALHAAPVPAGTPRHDAAAEAAVLHRWTDLARAWGAADVAVPPAVLEELRTGGSGPAVPLHRDLHDRQVLVADDGPVGLLDFDLLAAGEPALDLANLLAHLSLRQRQGLVDDARPLRAAVLEGYRLEPEVAARVPVHEVVTRARLAAVYAFRPDAPAS
jgi:hypothetical protein